MTSPRRSAAQGLSDAGVSLPQPIVHVCPLHPAAETIERTGVRHRVTRPVEKGLPPAPPNIPASVNLRTAVDNDTGPWSGMAAPLTDHIRKLMTCASRWVRQAPMLIHRQAGIARATAAALS